jgi:hypothetical protein
MSSVGISRDRGARQRALGDRFDLGRREKHRDVVRASCPRCALEDALQSSLRLDGWATPREEHEELGGRCARRHTVGLLAPEERFQLAAAHGVVIIVALVLRTDT